MIIEEIIYRYFQRDTKFKSEILSWSTDVNCDRFTIHESKLGKSEIKTLSRVSNLQFAQIVWWRRKGIGKKCYEVMDAVEKLGEFQIRLQNSLGWRNYWLFRR